MISLRSDNRVLTQNSKYAFLTSNYSSGVSVINITAAVGFSVDDFILIGEMGQESSEIFRIGAINSSSGDITLQTTAGVGTTTLYGHAESSKVSILAYDTIRFYWTAATGTVADETPTFAATTPLSAWLPFDPTSWYTVYADTLHSSGFGWFVYQNSITSEASTNSNPIPYVGFSGNTVASIFADFDSLLNVNELKLVTLNDKFSWLNEALSQLKNKLNLNNVTFTASTPQIITVVSGTAEYILPADFSDLISVSTYSTTPNTPGTPVEYISISKIDEYTNSDVRYYLRGRYIGFVPTPTSGYYQYRYRAKSTRVTGMSDYIIVPDEGYYALKSFMLYRSGLKFANSNAGTYLQDFTNNINLFIQSAVKQDANLDTWGIAESSNT